MMHEKDIEQWKKFHTPKAIRLLGKMRNEMHQELKEAVRVFSLQVISDSEMQNQLDSYRGIEYLADSVNRDISYANEISRDEQSLYLRLGELFSSLSDINDKAYQSLLSLNFQEWNERSVCSFMPSSMAAHQMVLSSGSASLTTSMPSGAAMTQQT